MSTAAILVNANVRRRQWGPMEETWLGGECSHCAPSVLRLGSVAAFACLAPGIPQGGLGNRGLEFAGDALERSPDGFPHRSVLGEREFNCLPA